MPQDVASREEDQTSLDPEDSDQEELDRFIAEIEDTADQEWAAEEAAEKEEASRIMYWSKEDMGMRGRSLNWRSGGLEEDRGHGSRRTMNIRKWDSGDEVSETSEGEDWGKEDMGLRGRSLNWRSGGLEEDQGRGNKQGTVNIRKWDSGDEVSETSEGEDWGKEDMGVRGRKTNRNSGGLEEDRGCASEQRTMNVRKWDSGDNVSEASEGEDWDSDNETGDVNNAYDSEVHSHDTLENTRMKRNRYWKQNEPFETINGRRLTKASSDVGTESDIDMFGESDSPLWESDEDEECNPTPRKVGAYEYTSSGDSDEEIGSNDGDRERTIESKKKNTGESWDSD